MRILIDTNILADLLLGRDPYYYIAYDILTMCADQKVYGYIAAHSIPNLFYILRKSMTKEERREALKDICQIVKVEGIDSFKILSALDNGRLYHNAKHKGLFLIKNSCYSSRRIFKKVSIDVYIENCKKI